LTRKLRRRLAFVAIGVFSAGIYLGFVFPTTQFIAERHQLSSAQRELAALNRSNRELSTTVAKYEDPRFLDKLARDEFGLVKPGEFSYQIMPGSPLYVPPSGKPNSPAPLPGN
jgi:cell division protein FtsB